MSRLTFPTIASLLLAASPALAGSQTTTEQVASFDATVEAPGITLSACADGPERVTEAIASFEAPVLGAALVASMPGSGAQSTTEQIAAFDAAAAPSAAAAAAVTPSRVAARCEKSCACGRG